MWQSLRANLRPGDQPHVVVLSALHGLMGPNVPVEPYELPMSEQRLSELEVEGRLSTRQVRWPRKATRVMVAGGGLYRKAMRRIVGELQGEGTLARDLEVTEVAGGIGEQRSQLGQFVRDPEQVPAQFVGYMRNGTPLHRQLGEFRLGDRVLAHGRKGTVKALFEMFGASADVEFDDERSEDLQQRRPRERPYCAWVGLRQMQPLMLAS